MMKEQENAKEQLISELAELRQRITELETLETEHKRVEDALRESEERFRRMADNIQDGLTIIEQGKVVYVNERACEIFGYPRDELVKLTGLDVAAPEEKERLQRIREEAEKMGVRPKELEFWIVRKDGTRRCIHNRYSVSHKDGGIAGRYVVTTDITARKREEEQKERMQARLQQAARMNAIGTLVSGVAHEFNNLLAAIQGYAELAMMQFDEADPSHADLSKIVRAAERGAKLTRQLLLYGRKYPIEPTLLNLNRTVGHLLEMLNRLIGEDIAINIDLEPDLWTVRADRASIEQVIMNMALNAREAMPNGGELTINTKKVTLDEEHCKRIPEARPGKFVCLSIGDTGVGMDEEIMQHIFEPFFTTKETGAGLGLSVAYGIVKQHEGWINVYSESGQGSTFRVYLPSLAMKPEGEIEEKISLQDLQGSGERILLVEDEEDVRDFLARALRENGYIVFETANAEEALRVFEREEGSFQLVFADVVLPDFSGLELVDQLLSRKPQLRVLLSSGYTDDRSQWPVIRERGFRFLQKPYALADLLRAVREVIEPS